MALDRDVGGRKQEISLSLHRYQAEDFISGGSNILEELFFPKYDMQSDESHPTVQRNISPSLGSKGKPSKKPA